MTTPNFPDQLAEIAYLQEELQIRDQLVQQLSQELFRMVKGNSQFMTGSCRSGEADHDGPAIQEQVTAPNNGEIYQLRQSVQELTERCQMLEQVIQEFPQIYRRKFTERMQVVKERISLLQRENRRLHSELQSVSYRLAVRSRRSTEVDLPRFPRLSSAGLGS
ncbi:hypothetical protein DO97_00560 [Neosynechococcus sphagnicola sy1]|uniref:Basic region leucine zipper n=1 Tax=Neosynechococcus sphagnicola sy1 TaxID=1497020 RepID=A0A098TP09_9CYAN|nr:hypothetical protein DO97_00560 [Neosynechococcus sphagnicola sy1]